MPPLELELITIFPILIDRQVFRRFQRTEKLVTECREGREWY